MGGAELTCNSISTSRVDRASLAFVVPFLGLGSCLKGAHSPNRATKWT